MSGSPTVRSSWRWVPSPQSKSRRSPPRRSSVAGRPRRAVGTEPAVPAKKSERSMRGGRGYRRRPGSPRRPERSIASRPCLGRPGSSRSSASSSCAATSSTSPSRWSSARPSQPWSTRSSRTSSRRSSRRSSASPTSPTSPSPSTTAASRYGDFLNAVLTFVLVAAALFFFVIKPVNYLMERRRTGPDVESTTHDCPRVPQRDPDRRFALRVLHVRGGAGLGLPPAPGRGAWRATAESGERPSRHAC